MSQLSTGASDYEKPTSGGSKKSGGSKTIKEFCEDNRLSHSGYYKLRRTGKGPDEMRYGGVIRITHAAEARWHRRGEQRAKKMTAA